MIMLPFGLQELPVIFAMTSAPSSNLVAVAQKEAPVPVVEIIKAYGSLAGSECFGRQAPPGSSCQLPLDYIQEELGLTTDKDDASLDQKEFVQRLENLHFQWPLKPYGIEKSNSKTAVANKGAETAVYMSELEQRGLYDRHNPTGPLPTSLRPKLNQEMDKEGIDPSAAAVVFNALSSSSSSSEKQLLTAAGLKEAFREKGAIDYYDFLDLVGKDKISWP